MNWKQRQHSFNLSDRDRDETVGLVFDIQRFAVHDGGGIRTLVFLKGCPLSCKWCQNPESMNPKPELMRIPHSCIACVKCMANCPENVIKFGDTGEVVLDRNNCTMCGECVNICYAGSMTIVGRYLTVDEVMTEVDRDQKFYSVSGGGVTFSGGEPTMQGEFLLECLKASKERGLHTAIETCGQAPWKTYESLLDHLDLVLCDIKHMDSDRHKELTGLPNETILNNISRLSQAGIPLKVRLPLIPGSNDDAANLEATARFVATLPTAHGLDILPYHRLGEPKWHQLGKEYTMSGVSPHDREAVLECAEIVEQFVDQISIGG
ncbi:glycyl-radical enzyme activating protein [Pseudodesulfovibrio sediminis]|uniref:Glycyl-radical enzyme activating protein n=1 Tax=Pseudodesulfovibrio sediminis TaxID=2810563 RepID=A0ABM7P9T7_9BACT|nr:glycyl-radical enzyme activating protein [Pseudodesulfovibrio sediminis]BCS89836.1 glycyl-radical enzyme activating protein [Pseudodesulfovibrio sediminis]